MNVFQFICFLIGALCMSAGIVFETIQLIGVFRYKYVLNRIHAAALGDTLGIGLLLFGALIINGFNLAGLKILFILIFLWITSPVAAHMVGKMEVLSKKKMEDCCPVEKMGAIQEEET